MGDFVEDVEIRILVLDRSWVLVARCPDPTGYGLWLPVTDSRVIRRWGTTEGLGELLKGPTSSTVLDALVPTEVIPTRAILRVLSGLDQAAWEVHLSGGAKPAGRGRRAASP